MVSRLFNFRPGNDERGASMVEFTVALPLIVMFLFGITTYTPAIEEYRKLEAAGFLGLRAALSMNDSEAGTYVDVATNTSACGGDPEANCATHYLIQQRIVRSLQLTDSKLDQLSIVTTGTKGMLDSQFRPIDFRIQISGIYDAALGPSAPVVFRIKGDFLHDDRWIPEIASDDPAPGECWPMTCVEDPSKAP